MATTRQWPWCWRENIKKASWGSLIGSWPRVIGFSQWVKEVWGYQIGTLGVPGVPGVHSELHWGPRGVLEIVTPEPEVSRLILWWWYWGEECSVLLNWRNMKIYSIDLVGQDSVIHMQCRQKRWKAWKMTTQRFKCWSNSHFRSTDDNWPIGSQNSGRSWFFIFNPRLVR